MCIKLLLNVLFVADSWVASNLAKSARLSWEPEPRSLQMSTLKTLVKTWMMRS